MTKIINPGDFGHTAILVVNIHGSPVDKTEIFNITGTENGFLNLVPALFKHITFAFVKCRLKLK